MWGTMRISLPTHALVELLGGLALLIALAGLSLAALAGVQLLLTSLTRWTRAGAVRPR
jgi:hypothetical protein